jgi:hypothetical protein
MAPGVRSSRSRTAQLEEPPGGSGSSAPASEASSVESPPPPLPADQNRTGVVFVHGIGAQAACGTILDWSRPIVDLLIDWRRDHPETADPTKPGDPVIRCSYDLTGAQLPYLELEILEYAGHPAGSWVITEAWWAQSTRPPTLSSMTNYVRKGMLPIMRGICLGYRQRERHWAGRVKIARGYAMRERTAYDNGGLVLKAMPARRRDWIYWLDWFQMKLTVLAFVPIYALVWLALLLYDPFRRIPIKALQDSATLKSVDSLLTGWFGGLPNVADDNIQSANVRSRLANAIRGLRAQGCGQIVVVAHSGGAIVSFETLCDPAYASEPVDKLITLGEGLGLAWRIDNASKGLQPSSRLRGDLRGLRPKLRWVDFWSTYDPAPAGPIQPPASAKLVRRRSHEIVNFMSILEDHGAYWDNDEEFLIPLLQDIDTPAGHASDSRFFRDSSLAMVRSAWRRTRVGVLAAWRWETALLAAIPLGVTTLTGAFGPSTLPGPGRLGGDFATWWRTVPAHEVIAGPLDFLSGIAGWPSILRTFGEWGLGVAIVAAAFLVLARVGIGFWGAWDRRERRAARQKTPQRPSRLVPAVEFALLTAIGMEMAIITVGWMWR